MAGDWMKVEKVTPDKPEIEAMASLLSMDPDAVFGKCFRVWRWFDDHTTDGNAPSVTKSAVDRRAGSAGFSDAMEKVGWLVVDDDGVSLPRFDRHSGETAKQRALTSKRVASHKRKGNAGTNGLVTDSSLPREEKRREEQPPPTPASDAALPAGGSPDPWEAVVVALHGEGMGRAQSAVATAKRAGCAPGDLMALLEHFRSKKPAWEAGALFDRIGELRPGQDPTTLWPPPSKAAVAMDCSADRLRAAEAAADARKDGEKRRAGAISDADRLEANHGKDVDELNKAEMSTILDQRMRGWTRLYVLPDKGKKLPKNGAVRFELLSHFEAQAVRAP